MTSGRSDWTRDESRAVDGEGSADEAHRLAERRLRDPELEARLAEWEESADLWRDDAARVARGLDPEALADGVLARVASAGRAPTAAGGGRAYAAAALLLIGLGLAGSLALGPQGGPAATNPAGSAMTSIERARLDLQAHLELERLAFPLGLTPEKGR